ncbi:MAG: DUF3616 domain-containing protein [Verrucomicrobiales bacterium]
MKWISRLALIPALLLIDCARGDGGWRIESPGRTFEVKGKIREGEDVSAAAMLNPTLAVVGSDETRELQFLRVDSATARCRIEGTLPLLDAEGAEIDIEGLAFSREKNRCYVTGSHALSRHKSQFEAERSSVFSLPASPQGLKRDGLQMASLRDHLKADPVLGAYLDKTAAENGLDIEGIAVKGGKLYFGLRAPNLDGKAFIVVVDADGFFAGNRGASERVPLPLGAGQGIRDIAAIDIGFLLIAGPSGSDDSGKAGAGYAVVFWPGAEAAPIQVGDIPSQRGKPEALLVLAETAQFVDVLVFHDGGKDGAPVAYRISKPTANR